jgi:esterase/lipase
MVQFVSELDESIKSLAKRLLIYKEMEEKTQEFAKQSDAYKEYERTCMTEITSMKRKMEKAFEKIDVLNVHLLSGTITDSDKLLDNMINDFGNIANDLADGNKKAKESIQGIEERYQNSQK